MIVRSGENLNSILNVAARITEELVPNYSIKQSDPLLAAKLGIGNCLAKSAISAVMLERMHLVGPAPAIGYNTKTHPRYFDSIIKQRSIGNGHAFLFAASAYSPHNIGALSFNPFGIESDEWHIEDFSGDEPKLVDVSEDGEHIIATSRGIDEGFVISDWYRGAQLYQEAIGVTNDVFHTTTSHELGTLIVEELVKRDLPGDIS